MIPQLNLLSLIFSNTVDLAKLAPRTSPRLSRSPWTRSTSQLPHPNHPLITLRLKRLNLPPSSLVQLSAQLLATTPPTTLQTSRIETHTPFTASTIASREHMPNPRAFPRSSDLSEATMPPKPTTLASTRKAALAITSHDSAAATRTRTAATLPPTPSLRLSSSSLSNREVQVRSPRLTDNTPDTTTPTIATLTTTNTTLDTAKEDLARMARAACMDNPMAFRLMRPTTIPRPPELLALHLSTETALLALALVTTAVPALLKQVASLVWEAAASAAPTTASLEAPHHSSLRDNRSAPRLSQALEPRLTS